MRHATSLRHGRTHSTLVVLALFGVPIALGRSATALSIVPVAQVRTVSADAQAAPPSTMDSDSRSAPDFGPFDETASANVVLSDASANGTASQHSEIGALSVTASGGVDATSSSTGCTGCFSASSGGSNFSFTFDLPEPSPYTLSGFLQAYVPSAGPSASSQVVLTDVATNQTIASAFADENTPLGFPDSSGVLPAGRYRLDANSVVSQYGLYASASFNFTFTLIPEPSTGVLLGGGLALLIASARMPHRRTRGSRRGRRGYAAIGSSTVAPR